VAVGGVDWAAVREAVLPAARGPVNDQSAALTKEFKLTPDQKAALETIMDDVWKQIAGQKDALLQLCMDGKDTSEAAKTLVQLSAEEINKLLEANGQMRAQISEMEYKTFGELYKMLDDGRRMGPRAKPV